MPSHPARNEGFRLLEEFVCRAIPDPSLPPCDNIVPLATQAEVERVRVLEHSVSDTISQVGEGLDTEDVEDAVPPSRTGAESAWARLEAAINNLSDVDRQIIRLFCFERLTSREIAERMGLTLAEVHRSLSSASRTIRDELLTHGHGPPDVTVD